MLLEPLLPRHGSCSLSEMPTVKVTLLFRRRWTFTFFNLIRSHFTSPLDINRSFFLTTISNLWFQVSQMCTNCLIVKYRILWRNTSIKIFNMLLSVFVASVLFNRANFGIFIPQLFWVYSLTACKARERAKYNTGTSLNHLELESYLRYCTVVVCSTSKCNSFVINLCGIRTEIHCPASSTIPMVLPSATASAVLSLDYSDESVLRRGMV